MLLALLEEQTEIVHRIELLLAKAFSEKLVAQDPADKPAGELLKRMAAQRETTPKAKRSRKIANP